MRRQSLLLILLAAITGAFAANGPSLRGLSLVSSRVIWASGTHGTYLKTVDGGQHWTTATIPGAERLDLRDIKAFSASTAYALAIASEGGIFKTTDGGAHWDEQNRGTGKDFFLDCLAFWNANHGLALGDPSDGKFLLLRTSDGGKHWLPADSLPPALPGEGAFAASGTTMVAARGGKLAWFGTGGPSGARVFSTDDSGRTWHVVTTPMSGTTAGAGIFSLAFRDDRHGVAVGGDYTKPQTVARTAAWTDDGGANWQLSTVPPSGYRSGVAWVGGDTYVAVGTNGEDRSDSGGRTWQRTGEVGFNSVAAVPGAPSKRVIWAAGANGRLALAH
ncbi:MAG TPA: YCF48-related protein [Terriglobales bacterium]|nr:YCF48-related protein [Terriglobales bacterium]